jgi:hypothetical protein
LCFVFYSPFLPLLGEVPGRWTHDVFAGDGRGAHFVVCFILLVVKWSDEGMLLDLRKLLRGGEETVVLEEEDLREEVLERSLSRRGLGGLVERRMLGQRGSRGDFEEGFRGGSWEEDLGTEDLGTEGFREDGFEL